MVTKKSYSIINFLVLLFLFFLFIKKTYQYFFKQEGKFGEEVHKSEDHLLYISGSSTVYPWSVMISERMWGPGDKKNILIERNGSGNGIKAFCSGTGPGFPDVVNSSRKISLQEKGLCEENKVVYEEILLGYDALVFVTSSSSPVFDLSRKEIFLALVKEIYQDNRFVKNPYVNWSDINPRLPTVKIRVFGPSFSSGTYDVFVRKVIQEGANSIPFYANLKKKNAQLFEKKTTSLRNDVYVRTGENDNVILSKIKLRRGSLGLLGFLYLRNNLDTIKPIALEGVFPSLENIKTGRYFLVRPLYTYFKKFSLQNYPKVRHYRGELLRSIRGKTYLLREGLLLKD